METDKETEKTGKLLCLPACLPACLHIQLQQAAILLDAQPGSQPTTERGNLQPPGRSLHVLSCKSGSYGSTARVGLDTFEPLGSKQVANGTGEKGGGERHIVMWERVSSSPQQPASHSLSLPSPVSSIAVSRHRGQILTSD